MTFNHCDSTQAWNRPPTSENILKAIKMTLSKLQVVLATNALFRNHRNLHFSRARSPAEDHAAPINAHRSCRLNHTQASLHCTPSLRRRRPLKCVDAAKTSVAICISTFLFLTPSHNDSTRLELKTTLVSLIMLIVASFGRKSTYKNFGGYL